MPSARFRMLPFLPARGGYADFSDAMSIEKRYFTSERTSRS